MTDRLTGKNVLFFAPPFFGYDRVIAEKMEEMGAHVRRYDALAVTSAWARALLKVLPHVFDRRADAYYQRIIAQNAGQQFHYIFIIKGNMVTPATLGRLRAAFPGAKLCLHLYDGLGNVPAVRDRIGLYDYATSFDRQDCARDGRLHFRPLFYADHFAAQPPAEIQYDLAFCGTIHSDRYDVLRAIEAQCREKGWRYASFYYLQSRFIYWFYRATKGSFRGTRRSDFSYEKKPQAEIAALESAARAIIDIQHPKQTGLTMRTIEMLGMGKKLVTTNPDIVSYDFYNPANICVVERKDVRIEESFIRTPYASPPREIYEKYSLRRWVLDVLGEGEQAE